MIAFPAGVKVWIAGGVTDMRRGMNTLALQVQQGIGRDPYAGEIFCFRGRKGDLVKSSGMTVSACRFMRSDWKRADLSGRSVGREMRLPSRQPSLGISLTALIGAIRAGRNALQRLDKSRPSRRFPWASRG
jgi:hypothetical protein